MPADPKLVRDLFLAAAELPPDQRAAYLAAHGDADLDLIAAVQRLLDAHEQPASVLSQDFAAAAGLNQTNLHVSPIHHPGDMIAGRYKLLEQVGVGGMGAVWLAEQKEPVKRKVAIKLVKAGMDSQQVLARFQAERQALALMDHPNIAKVFDGGMTENARPFFVMEFVKGVPLTDYCNEARLSLKERLELFIPVCQAVQHAHQKGVIHRDLKPSNILVCLYDGKPVPKVIDFGLAKAMHQSLTENTIHTSIGLMVGTPLYMSPEQAEHNNLDVDTRSDIYSLGVILYELLTGTTPLEQRQLKEAAYNEVLRLIKEVEPPKPSTRLSGSASLPSIAAQRSVDPKQLSKSLSGDLDWIVMKALDKERSRRYETANGLARDVERFLKDEAVEASPPSSSYRLRKLVRKHRTALTTAAAFAAVLILGTVVSISLAVWALKAEGEARESLVAEAKQRTLAQHNERLAEEQRVKAEQARDRTRAALDSMTSTVTEDALTTQAEISEDQKKFLVEVLTYYKQFAGEKAEDESSHDRTASAAFRVAAIEDRLGRKEQAIAAGEMAREGYAVLAAKFPAAPQYRAKLAASHHRLGIVMYELDKYSAAEDHYRKALAVLESLNIEFPTVSEYRQNLANSHNRLGDLLRNARKSREAVEEQYSKALAIREKLAAEFPATPAYQQDLAITLNNMGALLTALDRPSQEHLIRAMAIQEKLAAEFPTVRDYRLELSASYLNLSRLMVVSKKPAEAMEFCRKALSIQTKLVADFPTVPFCRRVLSTSHDDLGTQLRMQGKLPEAVEQYEKSVTIWEQLITEFPTVPLYQQRLGNTRYRLWSVLSQLGKLTEQEQDHHRAITLYEKLVADSPAVRDYQIELRNQHYLRALFFHRVGKFAQAIQDWERGFARNSNAAQATNRVAHLPSGVRTDQIEEAAADRTDPIELIGPFDLAWANFNYGAALLELRKLDEAKSAFDRALALREQALNTGAKDAKEPSWLVAICLWDCGNVYFKVNQLEQAANWFGRAIPKLKAFEQQWPGEEVTQKLRLAHRDRAVALGNLNRHSEAIEEWDRVIERTPPSKQSGIRSMRARQLALVGKAEEAIAEIAELTKSASRNGSTWYNSACVYAVASVKISDKKQEYADRAIECLQQAAKAGWKDLAHMTKNTDLDSLRDREDFNTLVAELQLSTKHAPEAVSKP